MISRLKKFTEAWSVAQKLVGILGVLVMATLAIHGAIEFVREAPALIDANARHLTGHHDSIGSAFMAIESQAAIARHIEEHLQTEDSANRKRDAQLSELTRQTRYLVCLRIQRARELEMLAPIADCEAELLRGNVP